MYVDTPLLGRLSGGTGTSGLPVTVEEPPAMVVDYSELQQDDVRGSRDEASEGDLQQREHPPASETGMT